MVRYLTKKARGGVAQWISVLPAVLIMATLITSAHGQVVFIGSESGENNSSNSSFSFNVTVPADTTLAVGIAHNGDSKTASMTLGGSPMIALPATDFGSNYERIRMFYLVNPPKNTVSLATSYASGNFRGKVAGIFYFKGNDPSEPIGKNTCEWSGDPFLSGSADPLAPSDLPLGCNIVAGLSGYNSKFDTINRNDYQSGGGTVNPQYARWPNWYNASAVRTDYRPGLGEVITGNIVGPVKPNWNSYSGNGVGAVAVINPVKSTITYAVTPANTGTVTGGAAAIFPRTGSTSFTVAANPGYSFANITTTGGTLTGTFPNYTLSDVTVNTTVTASFNAVMRNLTYGTPTGATISGPATVQDTIGTAIFSVTVQPGYHLVGAPTSTSGTVTADGANWKLTNVKTNATVNANVQPIIHTVGYSADTGGSVAGADTIQNTVGSIPVTVSTDPGYTFTGISASSGTVNGFYPNFTLSNVTADTTVTANFTAVYHNITPAVSTSSPDGAAVGGTVTGLSGTIQDTIGTVNFTVDVNPGYVLAGPTASNGTISGTAPNFTLENVTADTTVTVVFTNTRPTISALPGALTLECGASYTAANARVGVTANDAEDGPINSTLIAVGGVTFPLTAVGVHTITYNVSDKAGLAALQKTRTVTIKDTTPPAITLNGAAAMTLECGVDSYAEPGASATDSCEGALSVTPSGSVNTDAPGVYTVTYTAEDSEGNIGTATRTVTVEDTTPPVITRIGNENIQIFTGDPYTDEGATVADNCDTTVSVVATGSVDPNVAGSYTIRYNATDANGNHAVEVVRNVQVVSLLDPSLVSVEVDSEFSVVVTWNQDIAYLNAALVAANYTVSGSGAGSLSANPTRVETAGAKAVRLWWDNAGEMLNGKDIVITVDPAFTGNFGNPIDGNQSTDTGGAIGIAPVIALTGGDITLECGVDGYAELGATANDNVDGNVAVVITGAVNAGATGIYTVTYTAQDAVGNKSTATRSVTVEDNTVPSLTLLGDADMEAPCGYDFVDPFVIAADDCGGDLSAKVVVTGDTVDTSVSGAVFTITYDVTDDAGNPAASVSRTVRIADNEGPEIILTGDNPLILDGVTTYVEYGAVAIDFCGDAVYTDDIVIEGGDDVNPLVIGSYAVTYTVADADGNETVAVRTVEVKRDSCKIRVTLDITPNPAVPGEKVTMTALEQSSSCHVGALHYQWEKRDNGKAGDFQPIPGADDASTFVISSVDFDDAGDYRCTISDDMITVNSAAVTLSVGTGVPALSGLGVLLASAAALAAGAAALRKKRD